MSDSTSSEQQPPQPALSTSPAVQLSSTDGLPEWCSDAFRERYRRGEVPRFGFYDPVYLRAPPPPPPQQQQQPPTQAQGQAASAATSARPMTTSVSSPSPVFTSAFFPPFSALVRQYTKEREATATGAAPAGSTNGVVEGEEEEAEAQGGSAFGRARPAYSWEHITSAEDLWNGPPLTTKIPPAADYERILLDRGQK